MSTAAPNSKTLSLWPGADRRSLAEALHDITARATSRWPTYGVSQEAFATELARVIPDPIELCKSAATFFATDFLIAIAAARGNRAAQELIVKEHLGNIPSFVSRIDRTRTFADDVVQEVSLLIFVTTSERPSKLFGYSGRGPLGGFLRTVSVRTAQNMQRGKRHLLDELSGSLAADTLRKMPENQVVAKDHARAFTDLLKHALGSLSPEERELLRLHYLEGLSLEAVAEARGVSRATAARYLAKARATVLKMAEAAHEAQAGPVTRAARGKLDVPSQLSMTLSRLFRT